MIGTQAIKILVIDDHEVVRRGVKRILEENFPYVEVGEAETSQKAIAALQQEPWDLAIVDIDSPDRSRLDLLGELHSITPRLPLIVLSLHHDEQYAVCAFRAGAMAYLTKETAPEELAKAVKQVLAGRMYITPSPGEHIAGSRSETPDHSGQRTLSERELVVLVLIARGRSVKQIAESLTLSTKTVNTYRARLQDKLQLKTTAELTRYALDHRLVE